MRVGAYKSTLPSSTHVNERWSMDFVTDSLANGRRFRNLTIVDDHSRESVEIEADFQRSMNLGDKHAACRWTPSSRLLCRSRF